MNSQNDGISIGLFECIKIDFVTKWAVNHTQ